MRGEQRAAPIEKRNVSLTNPLLPHVRKSRKAIASASFPSSSVQLMCRTARFSFSDLSHEGLELLLLREKVIIKLSEGKLGCA
jgi:hypothetical protein